MMHSTCDAIDGSMVTEQALFNFGCICFLLAALPYTWMQGKEA